MLRTPTDETRMRILAWLREPDAGAGGVTADEVAARFALPLPVAVTHLRLLAATGMVHTGRSAGRVRYHRDDVRIAEIARVFEKGW
ncbi:helix-turn-helix domain-containing protein [Streptomyces sp. NPDC006624]|uniref:ArsR/SmtB family transcription factor n=1 Tax=unclassified Streptomyces TaxID=2593676 RepID=UPI0033A0AF0E